MTSRIVVVTSDGPEQRYVTNRICREVEVDAILVTDPTPNRSWRTVLKKSLLEFVDKAMLRTYLKLVGDNRRRDRDLLKVLGEDSLRFEEASKVLEVGRSKGVRLRREIERLAPDFIVIYGTGIIPDSVLSQAKKKAFNMHTGISPYYRGAACAFWPIHEGEPEMVGATIHECTSAVDGGEIYATVQAPLFRGDGLHAIFARAAKAGADAYAKVVRDAIEGRLVGRSQDLSQGREFRGSMRGMRAELVARLRLSGMRRNWPIEP